MTPLREAYRDILTSEVFELHTDLGVIRIKGDGQLTIPEGMELTKALGNVILLNKLVPILHQALSREAKP